ncbi:MAG: hypothetical protein Q9226_002933 [Calogaya cf. arnoldii]
MIMMYGSLLHLVIQDRGNSIAGVKYLTDIITFAFRSVTRSDFLFLQRFPNTIPTPILSFPSFLPRIHLLHTMRFFFSPLTLLTFLSPCIAQSTSYTPLPSSQDELQIRDKLALYAYAIDFKRFDDLEEVFIRDAYAIYGAGEGDRLRGVPAIKNWISTAVIGQESQHAVNSILVSAIAAPTDPGQNQVAKLAFTGVNSTSSFIATYGAANNTGNVVTIREAPSGF